MLNVITNGDEKPSNVITPVDGCKPLEENGTEILNETNILEMPDNTSDDGVGLSDIPIISFSFYHFNYYFYQFHFYFFFFIF